MLVFEPGAQNGREAAFSTWTKGDKRLVRFTAPADSKGMAMLSEGRDTMYVYLPAFGKVRRMGTHAKNQSFMGSDVSNEDQAETSLAGAWQPKLLGAEGKEWLLELTLRPGKESVPEAQKIMTKEIHQITKIEFYDEKGGKAKTSTRTGYTKDQGTPDHYSPAVITFIDHRRNEAASKTGFHISNAKVNTGLGDNLFSQRSLLRGQ